MQGHTTLVKVRVYEIVSLANMYFKILNLSNHR